MVVKPLKAKDKEENLRRKKWTYYFQRSKNTADFSVWMGDRRQLNDMFKVLKERKNSQFRILYLLKLFFKNDRKIYSFLDKQAPRHAPLSYLISLTKQI